MNNLIEKYRRNELTSKELLELKEKLLLASDEEIGRQMLEQWRSEEIDVSSVDDKRINRLKNRIDAKRSRKRAVFRRLVRAAQIAVAVMFPVLLSFSIYFYRENSLILSEEISVSTGKAERASITLPDGTIVSLNAESILKYHPRNYNKIERKINFDGEGYFQIHGDVNIPFLLYTNGLQVKVLGTVFNLSVRKENPTAELALEEGKLSLFSIRNGQSAVLHKNQKAIINQMTGEITLISDENIQDVSAWRRGDMVFRNTELAQVIRTIEVNYNIAIDIECSDCLSDTFTGTLPVNDLNEVLEVIERSYHLKALLNGKKITLMPEPDFRNQEPRLLRSQL
ncbi:MAG: FecR domain-containing protein [Prevotellaceae bacterium]|jgi:ferric-dicitrate binding protein FerR (iron transport regulator)|nr:FecR domain-containing protein [Prevotellaceae bacterium]